jgi:hypothetical protein
MEMMLEEPGLLVPRCRYRHLAEALCRELHISLDSALQYTPFEAYQALGAEVYV